MLANLAKARRAALLLEPNTEYPALKALGVEFTMEPTNMGMSTAAIFDDTCGNLIQIFQMNAV